MRRPRLPRAQLNNLTSVFAAPPPPHPPGNINQLVLKLSSYAAELHRHGGVIAEFVNPKYADAAKSTFKSSTRLECMMQARAR